MKEEKELNDDLKQLFDTLEEHGRNTRRQAQLSDLIDRLEASDTSMQRGTTKQSKQDATSQSGTSTSDKTSSLDCFVPRKCSAFDGVNDTKRRKLYPLWWAMGAAAACLLLWLLVKPTVKQTPEPNEKTLVEETETVDSIKIMVNDVVLEEPVIHEELLAEEMSVVPQKLLMNKEKPKKEIIENAVEQPVLAVITPTEPEDTLNIESNTIPTENETPVAVQKPQRRVIRSLNLVCYECQKDPEHDVRPKPNVDNKTLFGQPQDPNMKNGSLAFEFKLN